MGAWLCTCLREIRAVAMESECGIATGSAARYQLNSPALAQHSESRKSATALGAGKSHSFVKAREVGRARLPGCAVVKRRGGHADQEAERSRGQLAPHVEALLHQLDPHYPTTARRAPKGQRAVRLDPGE